MSKVSIVVTTYHESAKKYLDQCIDSIANLKYPKHLIETILVARETYAPQYSNVKTIYPPENEYWTARGVNYGIANTSKESKYILYLNDDTILTRDSLVNMVLALEERPGFKLVVNALSPCDNYIQYALAFSFQEHDEIRFLDKRFYKYEDFKDFSGLKNAKSLYGAGLIFQSYLCIYATLIPRAAWDDITGFDENFRLGQDDLDASLRFIQKGWRLASVTDAVIWHFGGSSNEKSLTDQIRKSNVKYFFEKWKFLPPGMTEADM